MQFSYSRKFVSSKPGEETDSYEDSHSYKGIRSTKDNLPFQLITYIYKIHSLLPFKGTQL